MVCSHAWDYYWSWKWQALRWNSQKERKKSSSRTGSHINVIPNSVKPWKYLLKFKMICGPFFVDKLQVPHPMLTDSQAHSSLHLQHSQWRGPWYPRHGGELYSALHWKCFPFNKLCMFCPWKWLVLQNISVVKKENVSHISSIIQETRSIPLVLKVIFVCTLLIGLHKSVSQFES